MPTGQLLTSPRTALRLGCSIRTVHRLVHAGDLTPVQKLDGPNGAFLFNEDEVEALKQRRDGAGQAATEAVEASA